MVTIKNKCIYRHTKNIVEELSASKYIMSISHNNSTHPNPYKMCHIPGENSGYSYKTLMLYKTK